MTDAENQLAERFLECFLPAALQAGAVARRLQHGVRLEQKGGRTPESAALTAVDLATQDVLLLALHRAMPEVAVDAEEDTDSVTLFAPESSTRALVVIDPVDGTLNYARQSQDYAVMGALLLEDRFVATVVVFPAWGETYWAKKGAGCWLQRGGGEPERVRIGDAPRVVLVPPGVSRSWRAALADQGYEVRVSRCSAVDSSAPATGRATAAVDRKRPDRRRALPLLLTTEAGGTVLFGERVWYGCDPDLGGEPPCIAAGSAEEAERLAAAVRAA